jgi:Uma2 family endonuclease
VVELAVPAADEAEFAIPARRTPWTLEQWLELPTGYPRIELVDGALVMSPIEGYANRRLQLRILEQLLGAVPRDLEVMPDCSVALGGDRALIPDFAIIDEPGFEGVILSAEHHVLVGEIASPSTRVYDRTTKRALYAEAGVPFLMLVEPKPPSAVLYELRDGEYAEIARSAGGRIELIRPFPVVLDLRERRR